ncbi:Utp14 protein-domain-containing protein [Suillus clintonianus]|uniref:Utp14 protein-domain-containing protein n=1 Tax=Suillus clintonianus TaxID=1904413 RepID=UPI001B86EE3E|nr:Utp14 protein-domain-containing protein [Suillus clintonianus]KAG2141078.1 Utp14 protein-domain-containing protein [Suillus clintonianus]
MSARVKSSRISKPGTSKLRTSLKKSNAAGYAKRHSQKSSGKAAVAFDDVYEYAPSKVRRAKIGLELDREEATDRHNYASDDGVDLGGMGQEGREGLRARLLGENADDERVDSGDDEEIDSDDAFEESDEEKYAGFDFSSKRSKTAGISSKKNARKLPQSLPEVDLNEDSDDAVSDAVSADILDEDEDEEMEDGDADTFFDVLEVFDGKADAEDDAPAKQAAEKTKAPVSDVSDEASELEDDKMSEDEQDDQDEEEDAISASEDEASPEALAELESFLSKLDPAEDKKRKSNDISATQSVLKKRRLMQERTEAGAEGEFGVSAGGSRALKLDDLLAPLASSSALTALKKSTKALTSTSSKTKTLSAPLPQRAQERLDREAAYEQTKEEVDKWSATMKHIKQAEHLSFPLQAQPEGRVSNLELAAKFKPSNELESAVDNLLKSAQLRDQDIAGTEALKMAHLSVEEVAARRAELRMMRELAFRADRKAKRIAKIKSKAYRRIRKKQRERLGGEEGDEDEDVEDAGARLKAEVERARERATLRHKTTGKWAKAMQGREGLDVDQRQAIGEMLERGEKLRRRIQGEMSGDESEDSESDDEEQDVETIKRGAFEELAMLNASEDATSADVKSKSVFNMKFMRDAAARQILEADAAADDFLKEMGGVEQGSDDDASGDGTVTEGPLVQRVGGRVTYHPGTSAHAKPAGSHASETSSVTLQSADLVQDDRNSSNAISSPRVSTPVQEINPWLVASSSSGPSRKRSEVLVQKGSDALAKSTNKLKKRTAKGGEEQERIRDDAVLEIDTSNVLTEPTSAPAIVNTKRAPKGKGKEKPKNGGVIAQLSPDDADESDGHSEVDEQERTLERRRQGGKGKGVTAFKQRELVSLAFAGDNVVQTFEDLKQVEIEADAPREVDTTLPGWGSWGGTGTKKLPPRPNLIKKIAGVDPSSRADYKKAHVIISERRDKKAAKYLVKELPYPYTSHAQYARSMDIPIGAEWNTRVGFQRGTLPRVVKKMGTIIEPLVKPS